MLEPYSEQQFVALVDSLANDSHRRDELKTLLREDHPCYHQRGTATVVEMRGWVLLAVARIGLTDDTLVFALEELDAGVDPYLVATAACALRSYPNPNPALAPFVMRAINQIRFSDDPVSLEEYGGYATSSDATSPVRELLKALVWLGPHARAVLPDLESLGREETLPRKLRDRINETRKVLLSSAQKSDDVDEDCCQLPALRSKFSWTRKLRRNSQSINSIVFEDQTGTAIKFEEFFSGRPSIVVFFYTRCDNPLKCSLTVTKLARVQALLERLGLADQINTTAITYDPGFDLPARINTYGKDRGVRMGSGHRMLRTIDGLGALRQHFQLGVNFIESLVNRHRIEAYVLDQEGRIAASFERLRWDEQEVVDRAVEVLNEKDDESIPAAPAMPMPASPVTRQSIFPVAGPALGTLASLAVAFFPKCPICWATYLSFFGIAGLNQIPYSPWLQPILLTVMLINIFSVWFRARFTGRWWPLYLVSAGALLIVISRVESGWAKVAIPGIVMTLAGSLWNAVNSTRLRPANAKRLQY